MDFILKKWKQKKRGNMIIEQLLVFPFFIITAWLIIQLIVYSYSNYQMNTASKDAASFIAHYLRGDQELTRLVNENSNNTNSKILFTLDDLDPTGVLKDSIEEEIILRMDTTLSNNSFIDYDTSSIVFASGDEECINEMNNNSHVTCLFLEMNKSTSDNIGNFQVVTRSKQPFLMIGNFLAFLGDNFDTFYVYGNSSSPIDMPGRFRYY